MANTDSMRPDIVARLKRITLREGFYGTVLLALAALPAIAFVLEQNTLVSFLSLTMTFAMAAVSLNFILGYGGMISFGHAAFIAIGGYTVGIATFYDVTNGFIQFPLAIVLSAAFALVTGAICLRTKGVYFIMITLAFAQMVYYAFISIEEYGGDDGLTIDYASDFAPLFDLDNEIVLYYAIFAALLGSIYLVHRIVNSRFGWVIRGAKSNDARMQALGFPTFRYRLTAYVIGGAMCGIAGALFANYANFVNPDDTAWTTSGELIFMVVLGGMGSIFGPVIGALVFLIMEEGLGSLPIVGVYWKIYFGPFLILVVLFAKGGIDSWLIPHGAGAERDDTGLEIAPLGRRAAAALIDIAGLAALATVMVVYLAPALMDAVREDHHKDFMMVACTYVVLAALFVNHFLLPRSRWHGSIGKRMTGIQVVSADGRDMTAEQATQRVFGQMLSIGFALIGILQIAWKSERRALHDTLAGTRVVVAGSGADDG